MPSWMCETTESILADLRLRMNSSASNMKKLTVGRKRNRFGGRKFNRDGRRHP